MKNNKVQVLYQDVTTGAAWDITTIVTSPKWQTKVRGTPANVKFTALRAAGINWTHGSVICVLETSAEKTGIFYGYVFKIKQNMGGAVELTAYDQTRYLKNKDTYVFVGRRADQMALEIAEDYKIKLGALANTGYVVPSLCEDNKALFDIILKGIDETLVNTGRFFYLWDDYGALRISEPQDSMLDLLLGDGSMVTDYNLDSNIDSDTSNRIKLVRDDEESGRRQVFVFQDSSTIAQWGILQHFEKVDENLNRAQIEARGDSLLELKNRPQRSLPIKGVPADLRVRAGCMVYVQISEIAVAQYFVVEEATHDFEGDKMDLKLKVV